jgi:hypothetical protein
VYTLRALSQGVPPALVPFSLNVPYPGNSVACDSPPPRLLALGQSADGAGGALHGAAALGTQGGRGAVLLTLPAPSSSGSVEFTRVLRPMRDCSTARCEKSHFPTVTAYVWLGGGGGGGGGMPGEGLVLSLVDASKQTPGATVYMPAATSCGTRAALPAWAISIVFDTADNGASGCDEPGTGLRIVSTLMGPHAAPVVLAQTLEQSTVRMRRNAWVTLQFALVLVQFEPSGSSSDNTSAALEMFLPFTL